MALCHQNVRYVELIFGRMRFQLLCPVKITKTKETRCGESENHWNVNEANDSSCAKLVIYKILMVCFKPRCVFGPDAPDETFHVQFVAFYNMCLLVWPSASQLGFQVHQDFSR